MRSVSCDFLMKAEIRQLKEELSACELSVLKSLGANKLRTQMSLVGYICRLVVWLIFWGDKNTKRLKARAASLVRFFFPTRMRVDNYRQNKDAAVVFYFNHQSLFEVLAVIWYCLSRYPNKRYVFPVNLPWYEALCPVFDKLRQIGIWITPMITPNTYKKLVKVAGADEERQMVVRRLKTQFEEEYFKMVAEFVQSKDIIAVAPSATRTKYIFPSQAAFSGVDAVAIKTMPRTMSAIVLSIRRSRVESESVDFVPFVATRRHRAGQGLNIWRRHDVYIGKAESLPEILVKQKERTLDYECSRRLAEFVSGEIIYGP
ncbi:MAG: hypothetical protein LBT19_00025 [Candidatus Nomurabacteria bacterium]|jgi:hypothetical protein|nr:hypothetical protein [Candidatus Nomurabacteria bacterium]